MNERLVNYIETSFLEPLLKVESITDISYNGVDIFFQDNLKGRIKSDIAITYDEASDFLRQVANLSEQQFSYTSPLLDVKVGKYRINAVHSSLVRVDDDKSLSFSIRIASKNNRVAKDKYFLDDNARRLLKNILNKDASMIIAGTVGVGKTELQKYLLTMLKPASRIIVIDNVLELDSIRNDKLDMTCWKVNELNENASIQSLVKNALRSNPDWLIVAESRGKEMKDILNSAMSGHPIITTVHSKSLETIPNRIVRMIMMNNNSESYEDILEDVYEHFPYYIYLEKRVDHNGNISRYVDKIGTYSKEEKCIKILYDKKTSRRRRHKHEFKN